MEQHSLALEAVVQGLQHGPEVRDGGVRAKTRDVDDDTAVKCYAADCTIHGVVREPDAVHARSQDERGSVVLAIRP